MTLEDVAFQISKCKKCGLYKTRKNTVPGEGNPKAKVMFIGEAPGNAEDLSGKPFFGRAGDILNEGLTIAKLKREKVFITSVLKCHPPDNRNPKAPEVKACLSYLQEQILLIDPKVIVLLGRIAAKTLLGKDKISDIHGKFFEKEGRKFFVTYHPAAALRATRNKKMFFKDMEMLR